MEEEVQEHDFRDERIEQLETRLAGLEEYQLECCGLVGQALLAAGESGRRPVILLVRGGGYGDNLQSVFVAKSLRTLYPTAYIIFVLRYGAGLQEMLINASVQYQTQPIIDFWCETRGVIHHPWFLKPFRDCPDLYVDLLYAPYLSFGNPKRLDPSANDPDDVKKLKLQVKQTFEHHKAAYETRWRRDEWLRSMHVRSPLSHLDWIKLRRNLLEWQFEVVGIPYLDKLPLIPRDISVSQQHHRLKPNEYVTFAGGAGGESTRKEYPYDRSPVGKNDEGSWIEILRYIHKRGLPVVQLGRAHERKMPKQLGVCLLGETQDMSEVTAWVKDARFHIGIEGGVVHFARCVDTPSIVVHGPTGRIAFGYRDNINVGHDRCYDCFWKTPQWYKEDCPHGHPSCLNFPDSNEVKAAVDEMLTRTEHRQERVVTVPKTTEFQKPFDPKGNADA